MDISSARNLTQELQRLLDVALMAETDADREAAVAAIEVLLPQWHQAVRHDESDEDLIRELR